MERIEFEYVAYVWCRSKGRYIQLAITLSSSYDACKKLFDEHWKEWSLYKQEWDFDDYHIKFRKIVYTDWEVIYD